MQDDHWLAESKKSKQVINQRSEKLKKASEFLDNRDPVVVKRSNIQSAESTRATKEKQQNLFPDADLGNFLPQLNLLDAADKSKTIGYTNDSLEHLSRLLELKLQDFGISAEVTEVLPRTSCHKVRNSASSRREGESYQCFSEGSSKINGGDKC